MERMTQDPWISVIGIGDDGPDGLTPAARARLDAARLVVGGPRHLGMIERPERGLAWASPIGDTLPGIEAARPGPVAVLASGDPSWFGGAKLFGRYFESGEAEILPSVSSFQIAAARLGWPLERTACLSACGRPVEGVWPHLRPGARLIVLSSGPKTAGELADGLKARGYGASAMWVMAHLGGDEERISASRADAFEDGNVLPLNLIALECALDEGRVFIPRVPGLPDEAFTTDGTMTKRILRAAAISALAPREGDHLWDVGAGSGSIAVEWLRAAAGSTATAVEPREDRRALIAANATALCVAGLSIVAGQAPECFGDLPEPDAVFFGGGLSEEGAEIVLSRLRPGGRLVAHGVTLETQGLICDLHARHGGELQRIGVETAEPLGRYRGWRGAMPVLHWHWTRS